MASGGGLSKVPPTGPKRLRRLYTHLWLSIHCNQGNPLLVFGPRFACPYDASQNGSPITYPLRTHHASNLELPPINGVLHEAYLHGLCEAPSWHLLGLCRSYLTTEGGIAMDPGKALGGVES
ncbi:hypothetical protein VNO77_07680 [Canavalia gladiata]|uniref:Uncharacterized protein n=1 Tax=Canavalia gladiata TaxID=3824 RepID=A0AAN9QVX7_CANGL